MYSGYKSAVKCNMQDLCNVVMQSDYITQREWKQNISISDLVRPWGKVGQGHGKVKGQEVTRVTLRLTLAVSRRLHSGVR